MYNPTATKAAINFTFKTSYQKVRLIMQTFFKLKKEYKKNIVRFFLERSTYFYRHL